MPRILLDSDTIHLGDFVLVKFQTEAQVIFYVGMIHKIYETDFDVKYLRKHRDYFVYPLIDDISQTSREDIYAIIPEPNEIAGTSERLRDIGLRLI